MRTCSSSPYEPTSTVVWQTSWRTQHLMKEHVCSKKSFHINTQNVRVKLTFGSSTKRSQKKKEVQRNKKYESSYVMSQVTSCQQTLLPGLSCLEEWKGEPSYGEQVVLPPQSLAVVWGQESELEGAPFLFHIATGTWLGPTQHHQRCFEDPSCHQIWVTRSLLTH